MSSKADKQSKKKNETIYIVSVPDGVPDDIVETISRAHAKALMISAALLVTIFEDPKNQDVDSSAKAPDLESGHDASAD